MSHRLINRRKLVIFGLSGSALAACTHIGLPYLSSTSLGAQANSGLFKTDQDFEDFTSYFRMISDFGGDATYRFHSGQALFVPSPRQLAIEFVNFVAIKQDRTRRLPNGHFHHAYKGVTFFTDIETGEVLDTFDNPVTGQQNKVKPYATSGGSIVYTPKGAYQLKPNADPSLKPKIGMEPPHFQWGTASNDVWLTYPERFGFYDDNGKLVAADNSMYRYISRLEDLEDKRISNVPCAMSWSTETGMWPWMEMDNRPGHFIFGSLGRKYNELDAVPERYVEASEQLYPGHITAEIQWDDFTIPYTMR